MKTFRSFAYTIVEKRTTTGFGSPSEYDPQGEPKYTKRPGPKEKGRRATIQKSPKTVSQVKGEIEAAKRFAGVRSGGLDTRTVPSFVIDKRNARANRLLGPNPWDMPGGASGGQKTFERGMRKLVPPSGPSKGHRERAFRDFVNQSSKKLGTTTDEIISSMIRGKSAVPFTSPVAASPDPWKPSQTATTPPKPKSAVQPATPEKQAPRQAQKTTPSQRVASPFGGTPKAVSYSSPQKTKEFKSPKSSVVDVTAKTIDVTPEKPQLKLGKEPAGPLAPVRPGESQTRRPQQGPGRTGVLGKPRAGQMVNAKIEPVSVRNITSTKPKLTGDVQAPSKPSKVTTNITTDPRAKTVQDALEKAKKDAVKQVSKGGALVKSLKGAAKIAGPVGAAIEGGLSYKQERAKGSGRLRSAGAGAASVAGGALGGVIGSAVAGPVGGLVGYGLGSYGGQKAFDVAAGANARERAQMAQINRERQAGKGLVGTGGKTTFSSKGKDVFMSTGDPGARKTVQLAKTSVVKDPVTGKSQVGYLAKQGGQAVYKRAADPSTLAKTSTNWLERLGRTVNPGAYTQHDIKQTQAKLKQAQASDAAMKSKLGIK